VIKAASCENDISVFMPTRPNRSTSGDDDRSEDDEGWTSSHDGQKQSTRKKDCFEVLGLRPGASGDEIKSAYRDAIKQYHPDYVVNLGAELREVAERKTKELNAAYSEALSHQAKKSGRATR
jgi:DnaJ-domain-containing protein 1